MILFSHKKTMDPPFCHLSTYPIRYLSHIVQQFPSDPLLLVQPIFSKSPWGLWLRDLSNSIVTLGNPSLDLGPFRHTRLTQAPQAHQAPPQAHLNALGPLRHLRIIQTPQAHLGTLMSRTQSFTKLVRHLGKSRHLILLSQP